MTSTSSRCHECDGTGIIDSGGYGYYAGCELCGGRGTLPPIPDSVLATKGVTYNSGRVADSHPNLQQISNKDRGGEPLRKAFRLMVRDGHGPAFKQALQEGLSHRVSDEVREYEYRMFDWPFLN